MTASDLNIQLLIDGVWTTFPAYSENGWSTQIGPSVQSSTQASKASFALASDSYEADPTNPLSPYYGKIGRNTQARVRQGVAVIALFEVSEWAPDSTLIQVPGKKGKSWTDVSAEGILRRLSKWTDPIRSPMTRQALSYAGLLGLWPLEDGTNALNLAQASTAVAPNASFSGTVTLAGDDGAGGSDKVITIGLDGLLQGNFAPAPGDGYQIVWAAKLAALPTTATYEWIAAWRDADGRTWRWMANNASFQWLITAADGSLLALVNAAYGAKSPDLWVRYRMKVTVSGGTVTYEPAWYVQDDPVPGGLTLTFAGTTAARPTTWTISGNPWTSGGAFAQMFATTDTTVDFLTGDPAKAFNGYLGETAFWRYYRLMGEEGLPRYWTGNFLNAKPMGRQKPGLFLDLIQQAVDTDGGLLHDHTTVVTTRFRMFNSIIGQPVVLALAKTDLVQPLRKVIDDAPNGYNDLTGQNWDGTQYRVEQTTGSMSTQPPPAGIGRYKGTLDVSFRDFSDLVNRTQFELAKTTVDRPRYPQLTVDLLARPGLRAAITALAPGDLVTLSGVETDPIPLIVMTIGRKGVGITDTATLDCVPGDVYMSGTWDATSSRWDLRTSTMNAGVSSTATTLVFKQTADESWSTVTPYNLYIAGEKVTVTAMSARAGTGPYTQTATVTRGVGGFSKALPVDAPVHVATPGRWAI